MARPPLVIAPRYLLALLLLAGLYAFGLGGLFFIDDSPNLDGLIAPGATAAEFIFGGHAGPLGRPVSLATFWLQRAAYPVSTTPFLLVNIAIHLINVALLAWAVQRLQRANPRLLGAQPWLPLAVALVWGLLPISASASLMIIQRMTTLSASFVLLGLHAYLWARQHAAHARPLPSLLAISAIGLCTLLAAFAKENGALLPLLLLVLHHTVLADKTTPPNPWQRLLTLAVWLPSLLLLGYVASRLPGIAESYWRRPFTLDERLASQAVILWEYLRNAFLPTWAEFSPYRDDYPIRHFSDGAVQLALLAWMALLAVALWRWRKGRPLLAFALLWYLAGHLTESSIFPLFLYFEHRNYVPLIGPVLVLAVWFFRLPLTPLLRGLLGGAYAAFLALMLWQVTHTWGQRQLLAWATLHPDSPRALQMLAGAWMQAGKVPEVLALYGEAIERNPQLTSIALQGLRASCYLPDEGAATHHWLTIAEKTLPHGEFSLLSEFSLQAIEQLQAHGHCSGLEAADMVKLRGWYHSNPLYAR